VLDCFSRRLSNFESNRLMGPNIAGAVGGLASAIRGFVQPVVKLGLEHWPNPIAAVVIGYTVSSIVVILAAFMPRQTLEQKIRPSRATLVCSRWSVQTALPFCRCMLRLAADL
jgi:hypothetical protein